ncbi:MAG: alpha/beta hydrolase, partial [Chitinophagaceae bacterium]
DPAKLKAAIAAANRVYIFIHGIIGDTESMVKCVRSKVGTGHLKDHTDLVLCFDYENLNTKIEDNAAFLKQRLNDAGLAPGHNKNITLIAHSMGGLVSRWFVEQLGGNELVSRLVMLGTPNNGTPWADVRDMAQTLLTYAMNGAAFLKPWMFVLNIAGKVVGGTQLTLKQMDKDTGIYAMLNLDKDPMIPYAVVAGNTRDIIPDYDKTSSLISRVFTRVKKRGLYDALDLTLFKEANDVAVTNKSITIFGNTDNWVARPDIIFVPSDHMNYFNNKQALEKIANL